MTRSIRAALCLMSIAVAPAAASAQDPAPPAKPEEQEEARPTGLPSRRQVDVQLRRGLGHVRIRQLALQQPQGSWRRRRSERSVVRGLRQAGAVGELHADIDSSEIYGKVSVVGERTYGSMPDVYGQDVSSFGPEDLYIGWRSGTSVTNGENALDFRVGRSQYSLGHGFLLFDGASEGGSRGGYWTNARKAFELAAIARLTPGRHASSSSISTRTN